MLSTPRPFEALPFSAVYFSLVQRTLGTSESLCQALCEGTRIQRDLGASGVLTLGQQLRQIRNGNRILEPGWHLKLDRALVASVHGPLGEACLSAPTVATGLGILQRYFHLVAPVHRVELRWSNDAVHIEFPPCAPLYTDENPAFLETHLLSIRGIIEAMVGAELPYLRFELTGFRPEYSRLAEEHLRGELGFGSAVSAIVIPREIAERPSLFTNEGRMASQLPTLDALRRASLAPHLVAARVQQAHFDGGDAGLGLGEVAKVLGVSERTLGRQLADRGLDHRTLRDGHRRARALALLSDEDLSVAEIAVRLGYGDSANFGRACRRWFDCSPTKLRDRALFADCSDHAA